MNEMESNHIEEILKEYKETIEEFEKLAEKKKITIITATDVLERKQGEHTVVSFKFMFDSGFDGEEVVQETWDTWGHLKQKDGQWVLSYGNNKQRGGFGGGYGRIENGFHDEYVKGTPEMVVLMKKEFAESFKEAFSKYFEVHQFDYEGDLTTG